MNALLRRRMMMAVNNKQTTLYPMEDINHAVFWNRYNTATEPAYLTITNGNHVKVESEIGSRNWYLNINLSSFATNGQDASGITEEWFIIPQNAEIKLRLQNITIVNNNSQLISFDIKGLGGTVVMNFSLGVLDDSAEKTASITINEETTVSCIGLDAMLSANSTLEFDIEFYVDGERWI